MHIGFSRPRSKFLIISWLIRAVERTNYSHVYIRWKSDWLDRDIVYEASGTMVHFLEGKRFDKKAECVHLFKVDCSDEARKKIIQFAMDNAGASYGIKQLLGIGIVKLMRIFGKDIKNPFSDGKSTWVCSELAGEALKELGHKIPICRDNLTPKDIFTILNENVPNKVSRLI